MKRFREYTKRRIRHRRIRAKISGTTIRPRLAVFRSNAHLSAQLIDDTSGNTLVYASDLDIQKKRGAGSSSVRGIALAEAIGKLLAKRAVKEKIAEAVFDRSGYAYHGKVRALAEGARKAGLKF